MIVLVSAEWCSYCQKAKDLLSREKVAFETLDISDPTAKALLRENELKTIPQVFVDGELWSGGYNMLLSRIDEIVRRYHEVE